MGKHYREHGELFFIYKKEFCWRLTIFFVFPVQVCKKNIEMQFFISMKVKYHHEIQINIGIDSYQASKIIIINIGKCNTPPQVKVDAHQH